MKTMLVSDFAQLKGTLASTAIICVFVCALITFSTGSALAGVAAVATVLPYLLLYNLLANDETSGWAKMRVTLPMTRRDIVLGRYASLLVITAASYVLAVACALAVGWLIASVLPDRGFVFSLETVAETAVGGLLGVFFAVLMNCVTLPIVMSLGLTRAVRALPLIFMVVFCGAVSFMPTSALDMDVSSLPLGLVAAVAVAIALALFVLSALLACKLYERREF